MKITNLFTPGLVTVLAALTFSTAAQAVYLPEFQRPIMGAEMTIESAEGQFVGLETAKVVLAKEDMADFPTSILITVGDLAEVTLPIVSISKDGCGITTMSAQETIESTTYVATLRDARSNMCRIALPAWSVELTAQDQNFNEVGTMSLVGVPEALFSIQVQQAFFN